MAMGSAAAQGRLWGASARDWARLAEPAATPVYEAVFDAIALGPGVALLDAGCGAGGALALATARGAAVSGLDASAGLLEVARERLADADLHEGDLEALPFADASFDAVTAFNSVQFAADPLAAVRELARVARGGAAVAIVIWGVEELCESRVIIAAIGGLLPPPPPGAGGPFALSEPGRLEALARAAGLSPEGTEEVAIAFAYADLETAVQTQLSSGPARRAIEYAGEPATRDAVTAAFAASRQSDGSYRQDNVFRFLVARA
jgi:SAM-dependent methyltransferase